MISYLYESNHGKRRVFCSAKTNFNYRTHYSNILCCWETTGKLGFAFFAIWRWRGVALPFIWKSRNNMTYFHSLHQLIMFSSLLKLRKGGWSKLIWYWNCSNEKLECSGQHASFCTNPMTTLCTTPYCVALQTFQYFCEGLKPAHFLEQEVHRPGRGCALDLLELVDDLC